MNDSPQPHCSSVEIVSPICIYRMDVIRKGEKKVEGGGIRTDVGVPEHEPLVQQIFLPIHPAPDDAEQGLTIDQHLDAILLHHLIERPRLVRILQVIRQARAPPVLHPHPNHLRFRGREQLAQLRRRRRGEIQRCLSRS